MAVRWTRVFEGATCAILLVAVLLALARSGDEHPEIDPRNVQFFVDPLNPGKVPGYLCYLSDTKNQLCLQVLLVT